MFEKLLNYKKAIPDEYKKTIFDIDFKELYDQGKRVVFFDLDNTLISYKDDLANETVINFVNSLKEMGYEVLLVSNSPKKRVKRVADQINVRFVSTSLKPLKLAFKRAIKRCSRKYSYDEIIELSPNIHIRLNDAGHMLGSCIFEIWVKEEEKETKVVFTGDLGNNDLPLLEAPTMIDSADFVVMESTYGSRLHIRNDEKAELFLKIVSETIDNGGNVIIPSFAVGRTQEILYEINKIKETRNDEEFIKRYETLMKSPVYVDSPLAISATEVFRNNMELFDEETKHAISQGDNPLEFPGLKFTMTSDESKALNESNEASIIISASGMCEVGRIKHHLKHNLWNPKNTILFVGYQAPGTLGYNIVNGAKKVKIFGEEVAVNARIEYIEGYSGHADQEWLMNFIYSFRNQKPKHVFLVHGEENSQEVLKEKIEQEANIPVTIPNYGEVYELNDIPEMIEKIAVKHTSTRREILNLLVKLQSEMDDMKNAVKDDLENKELKDDDMFRIKEKVKDLEKQILRIMEG